MPWLIPVMAICMFFGALGQINSWLVGPIYMLQEASREDNLLGGTESANYIRCGKRPPLP
ncbi:putative amino acid transporter [Salmonella enterica subsp. enterica]|nr:putative amino acid transporter [Salmonella enterica subsp. enterica]